MVGNTSEELEVSTVLSRQKLGNLTNFILVVLTAMADDKTEASR